MYVTHRDTLNFVLFLNQITASGTKTSGVRPGKAKPVQKQQVSKSASSQNNGSVNTPPTPAIDEPR